VRAGGFYNELKETAHRFLQSIPVVGERLEQDIMRTRDAVLGAIRPGYLFEALGPRYFGPVNGHDIGHLMSILEDLKRQKGFKLLHVITEKGRGHLDAVKDPIKWHGISPKLPPSTPPVREFSRQGVRNWSDVFADAAIARAERDPSLRVITAAMPDNTAVTRFMKAHPDKAFDVGICEQHAVAFAAGLAKSGLKPVCVIFSTFLQRAFDQVFHEVALNHIPVVFCIDRAGVVGPDGATHNGSYDIAYMRTFPDIVVMAARDASEFQAMFDLALDSGKAVAIRYPRTAAPDAQRELPLRRELMMGLAEKLRSGSDVAIFALGHLVYPAMEAAEILAAEGIEVTVVNARFVRPMDIDMLRDLLAHHTQVFTLEEHTLRGGFASAVLEECALHGLDAGRIRPIALPDALVPHGSRAELMQELRLDPRGLAQRIRESLHNVQPR
jgi:1-deoxy-D-xylulose-5-phosphate synthase